MTVEMAFAVVWVLCNYALIFCLVRPYIAIAEYQAYLGEGMRKAVRDPPPYKYVFSVSVTDEETGASYSGSVTPLHHDILRRLFLIPRIADKRP